jgi:hypothetical protein
MFSATNLSSLQLHHLPQEEGLKDARFTTVPTNGHAAWTVLLLVGELITMASAWFRHLRQTRLVFTHILSHAYGCKEQTCDAQASNTPTHHLITALQ